VSFRNHISEAVEACHQEISPEKISLFNEKKYARPIKGDICHIYRDAKCYMIFAEGFSSGCHRYQALLQRQAKRKIIIIINDVDLFLKMPLDNPDIGYVSWDYPYIKVDRLDWDICEDRHVFFLIKGNDQTVYNTSLEVKKNYEE
jgi:uncharacterized ParB-like nuclease family protein